MGKPASNVFSPHWYRVASLVPRLRKHVQLHRHVYRGRTWYVLQDHSSGRFHRFTPSAHRIIGLMDGHHSMDQIWNHAVRHLGDDALTQGQVIQLLAQLYKSDVLITDVTPDTRELFERQVTSSRRQKIQRWKSPLAIRIPLLDPDRFIVATLPLMRILFSRWGMLFWLLVVGGSAVTAFIHWPELTRNLVDRVLAGNNILVLLVTFPLVKLLHEFGHAYAARVHGGEIHEMGIMFLIMMPIPYVDASTSSAFPSRWHRALVGSAGMLTELFLAALALHVWLHVEPGLLSAVMYNTMIIAGVSTLLFNANPLIRFDGYYVLADLLEIPNLGSRSTQYLGFLIQKHLFGVEGLRSPATAPGEARWFIFYGIASFIYRLFLITFIVFLLADNYFIIGVILAIWAFFTMAVLPIYKQVKFLMRNQKLKGRRGRAISVSVAMLAALGGVLMIPMPLTTVVEGIVWADKDARITMESAGFVDEILVSPGEPVQQGQALARCSNPEMTYGRDRIKAQIAELEAKYASLTVQVGRVRPDRVQAQLVEEQIIAAKAQFEQINRQLEQLTVRSPAEGVFVPFSQGNPVGRFLQRGQVVGYISRDINATARVLVPQHRINLVRSQTGGISVRAADRLDQVLPANLVREVPQASQELPSAALGFEGGGSIATNPNSEPGASGNLATFRNWFQFDLEISRPEVEIGLGERVYARFHHGRESLGIQIYRTVRQTFLNRFSV